MASSRDWYAKSVKAFAEGELHDFLKARASALTERVKREDEDYLLNVSEDEYANYLCSEYSVEPLLIDFDGISATSAERQVRAEDFPSMVTWNVDPGRSYPKQVFTFHLPFTGDADLIGLRPNPSVMASELIGVGDGEITFDVVSFRDDDVTPVASQKDRALELLRPQAAVSRANVAEHNATLPNQVNQVIRARKGQILQRREQAAALGVPIHPRQDIPRTFAVPSPEVVRKVTPRPAASTEPFAPEPTISDDDYRLILEAIFHFGKGIEKVPATYAKFAEEELRDVLLVHLAPRFEGETSGETFNKGGKTDILIRHEAKNIFVAECLIWDGQAYFLGKITQLLGYLTWRDSKAAIVVFVRNKNFSKVLAAVENSTPTHEQFTRFLDRPDSAWMNYVVQFPDDASRQVKVAVLLFHLPS